MSKTGMTPDGKKRQVDLQWAVKNWPTPNTNPTRPNEGNVRMLRAKVLNGEMTESEAELMLNGKSVFEAQGKIPAWPTPTARDGKGQDAPGRQGGVSLPEAVRYPTPRANDGEKRGKISDDPRNGLPGVIENETEN